MTDLQVSYSIVCIGTCIAISIDIINLSPAIAFGKVSHNERRGVLQVTGWKCVSRTIRNRELWNPFPFFSQPSLREPIYLSFGSSFYSITRRTRGSHCEKSILCKRQNKCTCLWHFHYFASRVSSIRLTWPRDTCLAARFVPISFSF